MTDLATYLNYCRENRIDNRLVTTCAGPVLVVLQKNLANWTPGTCIGFDRRGGWSFMKLVPKPGVSQEKQDGIFEKFMRVLRGEWV